MSWLLGVETGDKPRLDLPYPTPNLLNEHPFLELNVGEPQLLQNKNGGDPTAASTGHLFDAVGPNYDEYFTSHIAFGPSISSSNSLHSAKSESRTQCSVVWDFSTGSSRFLPTTSKESSVNGVLPVQNPKQKDKVKDNERRLSLRSPTLLHKPKDLPTKEKLVVVCSESSDSRDGFSDVSLYKLDRREDELAAYMKNLQISSIESVDSINNKREAKGSSGANKKKKKVVDLPSLLIKCAEFVATGNHQATKELLKQIRWHSSPYGDPTQRLSHYFANGLEARMAGQGSETYNSLSGNNKEGPSEYLIAYCMSVLSSPFRRITSFACDNMLLTRLGRGPRLHIIDFGISVSFEWPTIIQALARRAGGPPTMIRVTGVDFPQPGPNPAQRLKETGSWLARHADENGLPFEYKAFAREWEELDVEDFKIREDEFVVVNLSERARNLSDETGSGEASRDAILDLIRKLNPGLVMQGLINGAFGKSFVPRFKEALFHYLSMFDLLDKMWGGYEAERLLVERDLFGKEAFNVVACEGEERVVRTETYKQWQTRMVKAGFEGVGFGRKLMGSIVEKVRESYHREFLVDEDGHWLLMSWKGRTFYAVSCWQPLAL